MSIQEQTFEPDPKRAIEIGLGFSSPLWPAFMVMTGVGVAYWWLNHLGRERVALEALVPAPLATELVDPTPEPLVAEPVAEAIADEAEPAVEEPAALQAMVEPAFSPEPPAPEPEPVLEVAPAPIEPPPAAKAAPAPKPAPALKAAAPRKAAKPAAKRSTPAKRSPKAR